MKTYAVITMVALIGTVSEAEDRKLDESPDAGIAVTAFFHYDAQLPGATLNYAQVVAQKMFKPAGVQLCWKAQPVNSDKASQVIRIDLTANTPSDFHPHALAYAFPFEGTHIRVFYDRIASVAGSELAPALLAHVLVHEITHILEGTDRHSEEGVMKAHWTGRDFKQMMCRPLTFTTLDVQLIQRGFANRNRAKQPVLLSNSIY